MMLASCEAKYGSKFVILLVVRSEISPPYCGLPSLSHQLEVTAVEVVVAAGLVVDVVTRAVVVFEVVVTAGVDNVVVVVVDVVVHDARIRDVTIKHVSAIQANPLFIILLLCCLKSSGIIEF